MLPKGLEIYLRAWCGVVVVRLTSSAPPPRRVHECPTVQSPPVRFALVAASLVVPSPWEMQAKVF